MNLLLIAVLLALSLISLIFIFAYSEIVYDKWKGRKKSGPDPLPVDTNRTSGFVHVQVTKW